MSIDDKLKKGAENTAVIKLVNDIIVQAIKKGNVDTFIEASKKNSVVSMRLDNTLKSVLQLPVQAHPFVISRMKVMSKLDLSNTHSPQNGRVCIKLKSKSYHIHISILPESFGEKLSMRISDVADTSSLVKKAKQQQAIVHQTQSAGKKSVMIVDDSQSIRSLVQFVLESEGYDVLQAEDGEKGWDLVQKMGTSIRLILTDLDMPKLSGFELVSKIREQKMYDSIALIMLTSRQDTEDEVDGLDGGVDDYICKPVDPKRLQARVRKMIAMYDRISRAAQN